MELRDGKEREQGLRIEDHRDEVDHERRLDQSVPSLNANPSLTAAQPVALPGARSGGIGSSGTRRRTTLRTSRGRSRTPFRSRTGDREAAEGGTGDPLSARAPG
jgi:hypothetical protein